MQIFTNIKNKIIELNFDINNFFYFPWILMVINTMIFYSSYSYIKIPFLTEFALLLFCLKIILDLPKSIKDYLIFILLGCVGVIVTIKSGDNRILWLAIVLISARNINIRKCIYLTYLVTCICVSIFICIYFINNIFNLNLYVNNTSNYFGLGHHNTCHNYFVIISSLFIFNNFDRINLKNLLFLQVLNVGLFTITGSRSGFLTFFVATLVLMYCESKLFNQKYLKYFVICLLVGIGLLIICPLIYEPNSIMEFINNVSTGRIAQANVYYNNFGIHLFGSYLDVLYVDNPQWYLDIGYLKLLLNNGIISFMFFIIGYLYLLFISMKKHLFSMFYLILIVLINLCFENVYTYVFFNVSILFFTKILYQHDFKFINKKINGLMKIYNKVDGTKIVKQYFLGHIFIHSCLQILLNGFSKKGLEITRESCSYKLQKKIRKRFMKNLETFDRSWSNTENTSSDYVWVCWMQGIENAPLIVKKCIESLRKGLKDKNIVLLTENNMFDYVTIPAFIIEKHRKGIIPNAHFTDLLRLELLTKYGGTWIDATVWYSGAKIPDFYLNSELFLFQTLKPGADGHCLNISNWFISSYSNNKILAATKYLLYCYWEKYNYLVDYYIFHHFFNIVIEFYSDSWKKVYPVSNSTEHILLLNLFESYNDNMFNNLIMDIPFHKLTYKFDDDLTKLKDTYYTKIVEDY